MGAPRGTAGPAPELRLTVRVDGRSVFRHGLAAGALGRWNDFSVAFDGAAGEMTLELDLKSRGGAGLRCRRWPSRRSTTWTATDAPEACC
jgi:hypothetical protein